MDHLSIPETATGGTSEPTGERTVGDRVTDPGTVADPGTLADVLADVAGFSAYFEIETGPAGPDALDWRPLADLCTGTDALAALIDGVARRLDTAETRIAASILYQGLAARLWSPAVAAAIAHGLVLDLDPVRILCRPVPAGPLPLRAVRPAGWWADDRERLAGPRARSHSPSPDPSLSRTLPVSLYRTVMTGLLEPLAGTVRRITKIAPGLLWGNAASALAGTIRVIALQRPPLAERALATGHELLSLGVLRGSGALADATTRHPFFVRRSCCLYYRLPGGGKCGDCALLRPLTELD
ncbi:(2Fe-2S)-binding protein [Microtetraspora sp. NBRC 16547]|uniref:(2Fe-2S)-binding protein n=1 Tax=Microtetraspora sp. NBRC 16547 TaxID=3030993 RepID=UPI0024A36D53|nr:(2Fe-2S)-binding protein [Microtetraspora sp. NBRC 16547]GLW99116.1 hypothetical protein Misp02_32030 [Microtetraspora sp. NBRC 16547]